MEEMQEVSTKSINLKWGAISGLLGIIFFLIIDFTGQSTNQPLQYAGLLITIAVTVMAHKEYKELGDGYMSFGKGLGIGTVVAVISSIINGIFTYVYVSFVSDQRVIEARDAAIQKMEEGGQSAAEIERAMPFMEPWFSPVAFFFYALIGGIFFGFIVSLLVTIFTKNQDPEAI